MGYQGSARASSGSWSPATLGAPIWVHVGDGNKLAAHAREGCWLGFDTESHAHHVYFRSSCSVAIKHNVYFGTAPQLEGEQLAIPGTEHEQCATPATPATTSFFLQHLATCYITTEYPFATFTHHYTTVLTQILPLVTYSTTSSRCA